MDKISFENGVTKASAETMNGLQDNVERAIAGVVESGSNENGSWLKFGNGVMICWHKVSLGNLSMMESGGTNRYYYISSNGNNQMQWMFPKEFVMEPSVNISLESNGYSCVSLGSVIATYVLFWTWAPYASEFRSCKLNCFAIGRWK